MGCGTNGLSVEWRCGNTSHLECVCVCVCHSVSPNYAAPATYIIGVYGRTNCNFLLVATAAADSVIDVEDGETYDGRLVAPSTATNQFDCKYYR